MLLHTDTLNLDSVSIAQYPCSSLVRQLSSAEMLYTLDLGHSRFVEETEREPWSQSCSHWVLIPHGMRIWTSGLFVITIFPPVSRRFLRRIAWKIGRRKHARQEGLAEEHCPVDAEADKAAQVTLWVSFFLISSQEFLRAGLLCPSLHKTGIFKVRGEAIAGAVLTQLQGG